MIDLHELKTLNDTQRLMFTLMQVIKIRQIHKIYTWMHNFLLIRSRVRKDVRVGVPAGLVNPYHCRTCFGTFYFPSVYQFSF